MKFNTWRMRRSSDLLFFLLLYFSALKYESSDLDVSSCFNVLMYDDLDVSRLNHWIDKRRVLWQYIDSQEDGGDAKGARSMEVIMSKSIVIDLSRGVDVFRSSKLVEHFEGADALRAAQRCAAEKPGRYIRYWAVKEGK